MKKLNILIWVLFFAHQSSTAFAQLYKDDGIFEGVNLELKNNNYHIVHWFCTGQYFSRGTFTQKNDTLFLSSLAEYDDRELRINQKWIEGTDSIRVEIVLLKTHEDSDLQHAIISLVGKDSAAIKLEGRHKISIPISFLPINEIYFDQKRASLFFKSNEFTIYYYKPYDGHFVRMVNEPFIMRGDNIYPTSHEWGYYTYLTKVNK